MSELPNSAPTLDKDRKRKKPVIPFPPLIAPLISDLKPRFGSKIGGYVFVDSTALFDEFRHVINEEAQRGHIDSAMAARLQAYIQNWPKGWSKAKTAVVFSDTTVRAIAQLLQEILRIRKQADAAARASAQPSASKTKKKKKGSSAQPAVMAVFELSRNSQSGGGWTALIDFAREVSDTAGTPFRTFFSEARFGDVYSGARKGLLNGLLVALKAADLHAAEEVFSRIQTHEDLRSATRTSLMDVLAADSAAFPRESQTWIAAKTGIAQKPKVPEIIAVSPSDDPALQQAAGLLLFLWDHSRDGQEQLEAFERYRELCGAAFHLEIKGDVGTQVTVDPRRHEAAPSVMRGTLLRPWVEYVNPPDSKVVIRGLIER